MKLGQIAALLVRFGVFAELGSPSRVSTRCLRPFGSEQNVVIARQLMSIMSRLERSSSRLAWELKQSQGILRVS